MSRRKIYTIYEMTEDGRLVEPKRFEYGRYVETFTTYYYEEDVWLALEKYAKHSFANFIVLTTYEVS